MQVIALKSPVEISIARLQLCLARKAELQSRNSAENQVLFEPRVRAYPG